MKRDEKNLHFAVTSRYKYVLCDEDGSIKGYGLSRKTLEYHNQGKNNNYRVMTVRQYIKETEP